jgi:hypothetical protein
MGDVLSEIAEALATVEKTLDTLTSHGHDEAAFRLSKAHFGARVRTSWPASLAPLVGALRAVHSDDTLHLSQTDRDAIAAAATTFERTINS